MERREIVRDREDKEERNNEHVLICFWFYIWAEGGAGLAGRGALWSNI